MVQKTRDYANWVTSITCNLKAWQEEEGRNASHSTNTDNIPDKNLTEMDLTELKYKGGVTHATKNLFDPSLQGDSDFVETLQDENDDSRDIDDCLTDEDGRNITKSRLIEIIVQNKRRRTHADNEMAETGEEQNVHADGSVKSIVDWGKSAKKMDDYQQRAFQIIIGTFVLTYYKDAMSGSMDFNGVTNPTIRSLFNRNWKHLRRMSNPKNKRQLLMFLTGPGGSGKSEVVTEVL